MSASRFWLIRHALVRADALTCLYGVNDVPVCETTMAADAPRYAALAARLPRPARLLATPLSRTQVTAAALFRAGYPQTPVEIEPDLVEQDFGDYTGMPIASFDARGAHQRHPFWPIHAAETPPNGESFDDMIARVGTALDRLAEDGAPDTIIVTHGGAIRAACAHALGLDAHQGLSLSVDNISLTRLDHGTQGWRLVSINEHFSTCAMPACQNQRPASPARHQEGVIT